MIGLLVPRLGHWGNMSILSVCFRAPTSLIYARIARVSPTEPNIDITFNFWRGFSLLFFWQLSIRHIKFSSVRCVVRYIVVGKVGLAALVGFVPGRIF